MTANDKQHGGNHYKQFKGFEPWDVITEWGLGYLDGTALKYIARWKHKNGVEDLKKAIHFLEKAVEVEEAKVTHNVLLHNSSYPINSVWSYADSFHISPENSLSMEDKARCSLCHDFANG